jgi:hypothetical protein
MSAKNKKSSVSATGVDHNVGFNILKLGVSLLQKKVETLKENLEVFKLAMANPTTKNFKDNAYNLSKKFYSEFQEVFDLYLFIYLGRFVREEHYKDQPCIQKHKALKSYHVAVFDTKGKHTLKSISYFWAYCISYYL